MPRSRRKLLRAIRWPWLAMASIRQWKAEASAKYQYTCEPLRWEQKRGVTEVTCHLAGNFPGSPIDLRFLFRLERGQIANLEIIP
jgi:hypothetical protein